MSRRPRHVLAPNLFPFLAVLVCTMGTLILLLALVAQKAEESAERVAESQTKTTKLQTEEERWRADELQQLHARHTAELEKRRSELAHLEDHLRRLRQEMAELADETEAAKRPSDSSSEQAEARLVSLRTRIDQEKERLEELQEERDGRPPRVVIVPYKGTHGTDRRPIYVECTDQAVILQPEGVRITAAHLEGPLGPGNPLDAALRAIRDHWQQTDPDSPPPYPLLLVRPGGIHAYAACRVAMTAWDDQFGYELIADDMRLGFPEADAALHDKLVQTIREATRRQQSKIASMPRRYDSLSRERIAASEAGHGDGEFAYGQPSSGTSATGSAAGSAHREGNGWPGGEGDAGSRNAEALSLNSAPGGTSLRGPANGSMPGSEGAGSSLLSSEGTTGGDLGAGGERATESGSGGDDRNGDGDRNGPAGDVAADTSNPLGEPGGSESRGQTHSDPASSGGGSGSASGSPPSGPPPSGVNVAANGSASPSMGSPMQPAAADPHAKMFSEAEPPANFQADRRSTSSADRPELRAGNDWAIPGSMRGGRGTAIVRQMRLRCEPDCFVLLPAGSESGAMTVISVRDDDVDRAVTELAKTLSDRVESWGLAMQNGRWEPVLSVAVAEGADARFEQLQALLRGSGIRVEREKPQ